MTGSRLLFAGTLFQPPQFCAVAADVKSQSSTGHTSHNKSLPLHDAPADSDDGGSNGSVPFSGKAACNG